MKELTDFKELKKIKNLNEEFFSFIKSYGVIGVAVGIVMGQAVAKVINVIVEALVMPILEVILPGSKWQEAVFHLGRVNIKIGLVIAAFIDFLAISLVMFFVVRYILKVEHHKE
ncbi:MAG: MscL family protein [Candidatus Omnitrophica bacterium]|nr:MscL family protein [Candidatus Omnitrophota bacterium]